MSGGRCSLTDGFFFSIQLDGWFISKKFYYNITAIKKDITEITHDCFLGLHDGGFLTGPYRPPRLFTQGRDRQSSDHRCTRILLRSGVGTVITFLNALYSKHILNYMS